MVLSAKFAKPFVKDRRLGQVTDGLARSFSFFFVYRCVYARENVCVCLNFPRVIKFFFLVFSLSSGIELPFTFSGPIGALMLFLFYTKGG